MLKTSLQLASALPFIGVEYSKVIGSNNKNNKKLAQFDFTKAIYRVVNLTF